MEFLLRIGVAIGVTIAIGLVYCLYAFLRFQYFSKKYADYDRELSKDEKSFFEQSADAIQDIYEFPPNFPKWYSWFLYLAYVPTMMLCFGIGFFVWEILVRFAEKGLNAQYSDVLFFQGPEIGPALIFGLFACIFLAGWLLYFVSSFSKRMSLFVPMKSDAAGFDESSIMAGHVLRLEHTLRLNRISIEEPFDAKVFIANKIYYYRQLMGWLGTIIILPGLMLSIFDLRQFRAITTEGLIMRQSYWDKNIKQIQFNEIDIVKFRCHIHDDGEVHASYNFIIDEKNIVEIKDIESKLTLLSGLDDILRKYNVKIRPNISLSDNGLSDYQLDQKCIREMSKYADLDTVNKVFHVEKYLIEKP